jgi:DNA-binding PucR family transcriptional regulator
VEIVLGADPEAAEDLRRRALAPLQGLRPATAERLAQTLRSWLLHQGQRDAVAADLFVHAQTVRYRMNQVRELYGNRLSDPQTILELTVALGIAGTG